MYIRLTRGMLRRTPGTLVYAGHAGARHASDTRNAGDARDAGDAGDARRKGRQERRDAIATLGTPAVMSGALQARLKTSGPKQDQNGGSVCACVCAPSSYGSPPVS